MGAINCRKPALEPGIGTGLFAALMPDTLRHQAHVTGIELDPVTARIAWLLQPGASIIEGDFARTDLPALFDLAIGNAVLGSHRPLGSGLSWPRASPARLFHRQGHRSAEARWPRRFCHLRRLNG